MDDKTDGPGVDIGAKARKMMTDAAITLREVCVDPKWHVGRSSVGYFLRIEHPRHGNVDCILTPESVKSMAAALIKVGGDA